MDTITPTTIPRRGQDELVPVHNGRPLTADLGDDSPPPANKFAFTPTQLHTLLTFRSLAALDAFGGLCGLAAGLRTDVTAGLGADETDIDGLVSFDEAVAAGRESRAPVLQATGPPSSSPAPHAIRRGDAAAAADQRRFADRKRIFGTNQLPRRRHKSFLKLMWVAFNDKLLILLTITAAVSVAIGIYRSVSADFGTSNIEWVDGVTVIVAIIAIVLASAANDWQQNHKFEKLNERKKQREVTVVRSGRAQRIWMHDVLVGDVMYIEAGEVLAVDGILIQASGLHIDESPVSGESAPVHKTIPDDHNASHAALADPFILSGTTVTCGVGRYLVTSVGANSTYGRTLMSLREDVQETPLQAKLGRLGKQLIIFGAVAGAIFFVVLTIRYLVNLKHMNQGGPPKKAAVFFQNVIISITVVVIAVPEGLALNVTVALAFATKRMLKDNNLVRLIRSCEIMGNVTCVCSDKTGTLTQNKMTVVAGRVGLDCSFDDMETVAVGVGQSAPNSTVIRGDTSARLASSLSSEVKDLIKDSMALNSTAFESDETAGSGYFGSSTEMALLKFSRDRLGLGLLSVERANNPIVTMLPFQSSRKWMAALVKLPDERYRLLVKGAAEVVFEFCAYVMDDPTDDLTARRLSEEDRTGVRLTTQNYADNMLRPVAIAFRDFDASEVFEFEDDDPAAVNLEWLASGLVFIGVFGIQDPLRLEVVESVRKCQEAGVFVRMVTGDNFLTAKAIAAECGIYTAGGVAMDGPTFRKLSPSQLDAVIPRLQVLARTSPEDKLLLVSHLKEMKETVAVTGDGTNDALALKAADVGLAMGIQGTEVAKEAASIILLDDNFASIVKALSWGRTVNDAVKKFCQFQFTINITASILTISVLVGEPIFTVVQLLWINLIMDIFASLGLATDLPSPEFLKRKPEPRNSPIISITMWKMILGQAIYQLAVVFTVHYAGWDIFNPDTKFEAEVLQTLVFNIYVWMQFFNQHNCRRVDNKLDIWYQSVLRNPWFIGVQLLTMAGQLAIIFKGGEAFDTVPLTGAQWGWSLLFGLLTIPLGALLRQVPDRYVLALFRRIESSGRRHELGNVSPQTTGSFPSQGPKNSLSVGSEGCEEPRRDRTAPGSATEVSENTESKIDLQVMIDAAKIGRSIGTDKLELHPETLKDDPILGTRSDVTLPPSQDPALQMLMPTGEEDEGRPRRRRGRERAVWVEPSRPGQQPGQYAGQQRKKGLSLEGFLRSKRR
ncbi:E1-E2 ATPase domain-containing protein [Hirsutella rhossiliensis]|uniref:Calcium-transporting ATPase n=1 Tax=Hirsutella rhossiliensis TaxID=111463 RepID=A0A9P8SL87_9HYPO|nr:e1-E2 ATPase domain-containing protein [Hirsutella rhossiliensis]KAH0964896.1 e1-E2 ATPase domain-containing protein [Hirsutella rhossiliensis]